MPEKGAATIATDRTPSHVIIGGAGIAGLAIAWRLARAGVSVRVIDRAEAGRGATWAAGGMLAAVLECEPGEEAMIGLARWSQALWPDFAAHLAIETGLPIGYGAEGTLQVATTRDELAALRRRHAWLAGQGLPVEWLAGAEAREAERFLAPSCLGAIRSPDDHQVDPRKLVPALIAAVRRAGGRIDEHRSIASVRRSADEWQVLVADGEALSADALVVAAGAWSAAIDGMPGSARPPVRPAKGQALILRADRAAPMLRHVVWGDGVYLVPRTDGTIYIGATVEDRGYDLSPTAGGIMSLIEPAWRLVPGIEELPVAELVTGLRPRSRDDLPVIGRTGSEGLLVATGHHRNGILLAPATAELIAAELLGEAPPIDAAPFAADRFGARAEPAMAS